MIANPRPNSATSIPKRQSGLTLVNYIIVVAFVGVVGMSLLPVTRSARPAAYRSHCKNNLEISGTRR